MLCSCGFSGVTLDQERGLFTPAPAGIGAIDRELAYRELAYRELAYRELGYRELGERNRVAVGCKRRAPAWMHPASVTAASRATNVEVVR